MTEELSDPRDAFIGRVVKGCSFADVGGLWGSVNEKVSVAHRHGASSLAMIDIAGSELWAAFDARRLALDLPDVRCIQGDVVKLAETSPQLSFDVVHCSGVLYHMPDPMQLLRALRKITRDFLVLSSSVCSTNVESSEGTLRLPRAAMLYVPALRGNERAILRSYWHRFVGDAAAGLTREPDSWRLDDFGPWWWLPTVEVLGAMCEAAGFHPEAGAYYWNDNAYAQLLSVR